MMTSPSASRSLDPALPEGLSSAEARGRLEKDGPNSTPDTPGRPLRDALAKFWAPVPGLLEAAIVLQLVLHKYLEALVIGALLVFNAALSYVQESRAQGTLRALKSRLALNASVRRDGAWKTIPAAELVRGDVVKLSLGTVVAADVRLLDGAVLLDQSMLTGESLPKEAGAGADTYAGALVRRGEATALVTATGLGTHFGKTAELVRTAHAGGTQQKAVLRIVRNLALFDAAVIALMAVFSYFHSVPGDEILRLLLTAVLASIPVALPATFTLATALGARALAAKGVLPTRLSALDEAATLDVLCSDKTGTLTRNQLSVTEVRPLPGVDAARLLGLAALASSDGGQDSVDAAVRAAAVARASPGLPRLSHFMPFDPEKKTSEAVVSDPGQGTQRVVKGAFSVVAALAPPEPSAALWAEQLEQKGFRVLAVVAGPPAALKLIGLIALSDPPRADSRELVGELARLGVRTLMVTGDARATAEIVAREVGIQEVHSGILPEGKFELVKTLQKTGNTVGMCGDGANDAPALRQAQLGIAVSTATDVAKSAAGVVLTEPGLGGILSTVKEGREGFQRVLTYALNSVIKKFTQILLLAFGLILTGRSVLTPMLMVIVMLTGDFLSMSLTTDRVRASAMPNSWRIGRITAASIALGSCFLAYCVAALLTGKLGLGLGIEPLRTLSAVAIVFGSQATIYALRGRRYFWGLRPTAWLAVSSVMDVLIISALAIRGVAMAPLPAWVVLELFAGAVGLWLLMSLVKIPVFRGLKIS